VKIIALALAAAGVAAAAVVIVGTRGDSHASTAGPEPAPIARVGVPKRGSWAANADSACATLLQRFDDAMHPGDRSGVEVFEEAARLGHTDLAIFKGRRPPSGSRPSADVIAAALAVQLIALEELAQAEDESNEARARIALDRARDARRRAHPFAEALGLTACAAEASRR
jgi:hypothetical protein